MMDKLEHAFARPDQRRTSTSSPSCSRPSSPRRSTTTATRSRAIDFDLLRQELSDHVVEGPQERYQLDWPGKREALFAANAPIAKTLRPAREESVDFDTTKNLFIEGDNLDALKLLQESYLGKVKLIYIDPPYNTGNDFIYDDDFAESTATTTSRDPGRSTTREPAGRQHRGQRALPLRLAEHDVPAAEARAATF